MVNKAPENQPALPDNKEAMKAAPAVPLRSPDAEPRPRIPQPEIVRGDTQDRLNAAKTEQEKFAPPRSEAPLPAPASAPVGPETETDENVGTGKTAFEKFGDVMNKVGEMVQKFFRQIQSMGSVTLRGMATTLGMLGFKKAAEWLNEMAGADHAELVAALRKGNLSLAAISPDDPDAKAKGEAAERGQSQLADRFKVLAQTRGPAFTREMYYSETVREWKKKGGNASKTEVTHNDLLDMAVVAQELPATLPGQVQSPQYAPAKPETPSTVPADLKIDGVSVAKVEQGSEQLLSIGDKKFRLKVAGTAVGVAKIERQLDQSIVLTGTAGIFASTMRLSEGEFRRVVSQLRAATGATAIEISYLDGAGQTQKSQVAFEIV